jgi:hypothetical protein
MPVIQATKQILIFLPVGQLEFTNRQCKTVIINGKAILTHVTKLVKTKLYLAPAKKKESKTM